MTKERKIPVSASAVIIPAIVPVITMTESPAPVVTVVIEKTDAEKLAEALEKLASLTALLEKTTATSPVATVNPAPGIDLSKMFFSDGKSHVELRRISDGSLVTEYSADEASAWAELAQNVTHGGVSKEFKKTLDKKTIKLANGTEIPLGPLDSDKTAIVVNWKTDSMDCQAQCTFHAAQRRIRHSQEWIDLAKKQAEENAADPIPSLFSRKWTKKAAGTDVAVPATAPVITTVEDL